MPGLTQRFGAEARDYTRGLIEGKPVAVTLSGRVDRLDVPLVDVVLPD